MNIDDYMRLSQAGIETAVLVAAPVLVLGLIAGLAVSIFQAATQIQETTVSFVPKVLAMGAALSAAGPWCLDKLVVFMTHVMEEISYMSPGLV